MCPTMSHGLWDLGEVGGSPSPLEFVNMKVPRPHSIDSKEMGLRQTLEEMVS